jgi:hypothetical protein
MSGLFPTTPLFMSIPDDPCESSRMKRLTATILLLTLLFPALAYGVTMDDLVVRDGLYYKNLTATICLTIAVLLGIAGCANRSADLNSQETTI